MISVADDYSPFVLGRYPDDSDHNGEDFRERFLLPALKKMLKTDDDMLTIDMNGTFSCDPSFLEEAFGGAIRKLQEEGINPSDFWDKRVFIDDDDDAQRAELLGYIEDALGA